ncbi:MAG: IS66 family transposase [Acidimicrobiales bacterium]
MSSRAPSERRQQCRSCRRLEAQLHELTKQVERLKTDKAALQAKLDDARRESKRQAAPFSRNHRTPEKKRKRPGRRAGASHGRHGHRQAPTDPLEERIVPLPDACPHCGCKDLSVQEVSQQFQDELVAAVVHRQFLIERGRCPDCERMVRGRHPEQTSDALGAAGTMLGPKAIALAAWLHYGCGVSAQKIARLYNELGLSVTASGITQALLRLSEDASGTYDALLVALRASAVVSPDETSWRIDAERGWLWVFVGDKITVYEIAIGEGARGYEVAKDILGEDFAGVLCRDGWAPYRHFVKATHQTCVAHLLRRANELIADAKGGEARIPHALRRLLTDGLSLRDRRDAGKIAGKALKREIAALEERADKLLSARVTHEGNRRLLGHLRNERQALFTFLTHPGVPATNHEAERAIRPQVVTRKHWGGNKSMDGARASVVLGSVLRTATQQGANPIDVLVGIATSDGAEHGLDLPGGPAP